MDDYLGSECALREENQLCDDKSVLGQRHNARLSTNHPGVEARTKAGQAAAPQSIGRIPVAGDVKGLQRQLFWL